MKTFFLAVCSGALLGAPFIVPALWPLVLFGLAPLLYALSLVRHSSLRVFGLGLVTGLVFYGIVLFAILWSVLPLDWLGAFDQPFQIALVAICWTLTTFGFALSMGVFALSFSRLSRGNAFDIPLTAALWVLCEWGGVWWFDIQNYGAGSVWGTHFTLAFLGNALSSDAALVQISWLGGVYALSAVCAAAGALLYRLARAAKPEKRMLVFIALAAIVLWLALHLILARIPLEPEGEIPLRIAAISTQEPPALVYTPVQEKEHFDTLKEILPATRGADIVLFPEGSDFLRTLREPAPAQANPWLRSMYTGVALPIIVDSGSGYASDGTARSHIEVYQVDRDTSAFQDKRFLIPYGEYVPAYLRGVIMLAGKGEALKSLEAYRSLTPGNDVRPLQAGTTALAVLFCNETMSPTLYRALADEGAQLFVNAASRSWFHGSRIVARQMMSMAVIRAVESRRWYVQASNDSPAFVLDPWGRVATSSPWGVVGVIHATVYARDDATPYDRLGPWVLWLAAAAVLITFIRIRRRVR